MRDVSVLNGSTRRGFLTANTKILDRFHSFCNKHSEIEEHELFSLALLDFLNRYEEQD